MMKKYFLFGVHYEEVDDDVDDYARQIIFTNYLLTCQLHRARQTVEKIVESLYKKISRNSYFSRRSLRNI